MKSSDIASLSERGITNPVHTTYIYALTLNGSRPTISNILVENENQRHALNHTLATVAVHATHVGKRWSNALHGCVRMNLSTITDRHGCTGAEYSGAYDGFDVRYCQVSTSEKICNRTDNTDMLVRQMRSRPEADSSQLAVGKLVQCRQVGGSGAVTIL